MNPQLFHLQRDHDVSGVSGTGRVADGVQWADGTATVRWLGDRPSTVHWERLADAIAIHGHGGATRLVWAIPQPPAADQTPLRDRIAAALYERERPPGEPAWTDARPADREVFEAMADAVLAVLPATTNHDTDTGAARLERVREWVTSDVVTARSEFGNGYREAQRDIRDLLNGRRVADETAATETQAAAPGRRQTVEYFAQSQQPDGTWESASSFSTDLDFAAARLAARRKKMPDLTLRLAERTTTVAVRALPDCLSCRHWSCNGADACGALLDAWQRCDCTGVAAGARQDGAHRG